MELCNKDYYYYTSYVYLFIFFDKVIRAAHEGVAYLLFFLYVYCSLFCMDRKAKET